MFQQELSNIANSSGLPSISVHVVQIHPDTLGNLNSHESEAFWRETVGATAEIVSEHSLESWVLDSGVEAVVAMVDNLLKSTALTPLDSLKVNIREIAQGVQATAKGNASTCRSPVWVGIIGIECGVEVEVLLNMDEVDIVLREQLTDACGVCSLVSGNFVAIQEVWQASNIESDCVKCPCRLSAGELENREQ